MTGEGGAGMTGEWATRMTKKDATGMTGEWATWILEGSVRAIIVHEFKWHNL